MMTPILSPSNRKLLRQFAWSNVLLAFDFDGTLAPIVPERGEARMRPATRRLLQEVALRYPCVVLSGRARSDVARRLVGVPLKEIVGNHGLESLGTTDKCERSIRRWHLILRQRLLAIPGVEIEDKRFSLAIHFRRSRQRVEAFASIREALASLRRVRIVGGKNVVNVLPPDGPHKGLALKRLRASLGCDSAIYVGDDDTDEDVFSLDPPGQLLGIRVGANSRSAASHYLRGQAQIDSLLRELAVLRAFKENLARGEQE